MGYLGVISALAVLSVCLADEGCPPSTQISPCTCDGEGMSCVAKTTTEQHIRRAFKGSFKHGGVLNVYIQGTSLKNLDKDIFGSVKAQNFYCELNEIGSLDMSVFDHTSQYISTLSLFGNNLTSFSFSYLTKCPRLMTLNLGRNGIRTIPSNAFSHNGLSSIIMPENCITSIGENAFRAVPNLQRLELSSNCLTEVGPRAIALSSGLAGLQINLANNQISKISSSAFEGANPQVTFFTNNRLTSLKQDFFGAFLSRISQHGGVIEVSGNPLNCRGCDYGWIVDNKIVLSQMIYGFMCSNGIGIQSLTRSLIGC